MHIDLDALAERIKKIPFRDWAKLADQAGVSRSLPRKIVYEREDKFGRKRNFGVHTIGPLLAFFDAEDKRRTKKRAA